MLFGPGQVHMSPSRPSPATLPPDVQAQASASAKAVAENLRSVLTPEIAALATKTMDGSRKLITDWVLRRWATVVADILSDLTDADILLKTDLLRTPDVEQGMKELKEDCGLFYKIVVRSASQRAWSSQAFSELPPDCWTRVLSGNMTEAGFALEEMRYDKQCVDKALGIVRSSEAHEEKQAGILSAV